VWKNEPVAAVLVHRLWALDSREENDRGCEAMETCDTRRVQGGIVLFVLVEEVTAMTSTIGSCHG
jgi:hypothetical protein